MAKPIVLIALAGAAAFVMSGKKKKRKGTEEEVVIDEVIEEEPAPEPQPGDAPTLMGGIKTQTTAVPKTKQTMLPVMSPENEALARQIMTERFKTMSLEGPQTFFELNRTAATQIWPGIPWPTSIEATQNVPLYIDKIWKKLTGIAHEVTGYIAP